MFHYVGTSNIIHPICLIYDHIFMLVPVICIWNNVKVNISELNLCVHSWLFSNSVKWNYEIKGFSLWKLTLLYCQLSILKPSTNQLSYQQYIYMYFQNKESNNRSHSKKVILHFWPQYKFVVGRNNLSNMIIKIFY